MNTMQTPGFKLQIGNTNIMSLQQKMIAPMGQQQQVMPPAMTMIQPSTIGISSAAELKRLPPSIKILKPIAPKPVITNYTSTVIKSSGENNSQPSAAGLPNVSHHVLPFGTTIKVTAGNDPLPIPISKPQHVIQPPQLVPSQPLSQQQLSQIPVVPQAPLSPQTSSLMKAIRPVSPASIAPPHTAVLSPNQNKVIINKIIYKTPENHLGPGPTAGQSRIVPVTPPLSPVSRPELKRKIIITAPGNRRRPIQSVSATRSTATQPGPAQIIVQTATPPLIPPLAPRTTIDKISTSVQAIFPSCASNNITVTQVISPTLPQLASMEEEIPQSTMNDAFATESAGPCDTDQDIRTVSQSNSQVDISETEVSSTTTEQVLDGCSQDSKEQTEDEADQFEPIEMDQQQNAPESNQTQMSTSNGDAEDTKVEEQPMLVDEPEVYEGPGRSKTPIEEQREILENLWNEQMVSPRMQKRSNSEIQELQSLSRMRRLSEPVKQESLPVEDEVAPMPKPLSIFKLKPKRKSKSHRSTPTRSLTSLLCNEKFEIESDESRSIKTSASSLNTISPPKKEGTSSESTPAFDQDKLQAAIEIYKRNQAISNKTYREKTRSESRSVADREDKEEKDYIEGDFGSTPSDLFKWDDGIGYMRNSYLHFQFNQFGLVEPMEPKEYSKHVKTNVYESLKEPISSRTTFKTNRDKRKMLPEEISYRCRCCRSRGVATDFATPDYCSVTCMKLSKNESVLASIARSKSLQRKGLGSSESEMSNNTPLPTSDDDSLGSSINFSNAFKEKNIARNKETAIKSIADVPIALSESSNVPRFTWENYLLKAQGTPAPVNLFVNPFPSGPNKFRAGMKLEAIDPENNSLFCVCTIAEVRGYRMRLSFDGYSRYYDFWINADSLDIFQPGWCRKTGRVLQPPNGYEGQFSWIDYLTKTHSMAASRYLFTHLNSTSNENKFEIGMSLEADDLKKSGKVCVASVSDKIDNRILVHFDGWDERYDYWVDVHSPYIHHINWHQENGYNITPPPDWNKGSFNWSRYLRLKSRRIGKTIVPADKSLFVTRHPMEFEPGMKLEVVDRKNQMLIRPATVVATDGYEIKVCFDGWPNFYSFWIEDDSSDIHPINWCKRTNHPIEFPPDHRPVSIKSTCEVPYCLGQGNARLAYNRNHMKVVECPYRTDNWLQDDRKRPRLTHDQIITSNYYSSEHDAVQLEAPAVKKIKSEPDDIPNISIQTAATDAPQQPPATGESQTNSGVDPMIKTALPVITDYGPRLKQSYKLWKNSSRVLDRCIEGLSEFKRNPLRWSVEEVANYVEHFPGCAEVGNQIRDEQINGAGFLSLTQDDLVKYLDVKLGPAIKLYNRIIHLRLQVENHFVKF
ncbi:lethal(3)malignant brain tumor-like protein 3 isoform X2 [Malaya genurostris]|uniref:lethal(3)malignant brain tumor-like protein 3 isoform X2 n=1 Tax=Malaya genurostris TaxID=325434 RepID=UPI0026F3BE01|nr:lethal(3)malignant brain tumor-like protein 3 isoform X2 [Malaya genurostris]